MLQYDILGNRSRGKATDVFLTSAGQHEGSFMCSLSFVNVLQYSMIKRKAMEQLNNLKWKKEGETNDRYHCLLSILCTL